MGICKELLMFSAKLFASSLYRSRGSHVQHVFARSVAALVLLLMAISPPLLLTSPAGAGELASQYQQVRPTDFFDWEYAKKVWYEMDSRAALDAEWEKYAPDFEPWLESYKKNANKAMKALKTYPEDKRLRIQRGHDIQLAWDQWWDQVYVFWFSCHKTGHCKYPFDEVLAANQKNTCVPSESLTQCGPFPDWRTTQNRAEEQAMMKKVAAEAAARRK